MRTADWRRANDYRFTGRLSREQWAWEVFAPDPDYRAQWARFLDDPIRLETDYGSPPDRDFVGRGTDPRAYVAPAVDDAGQGCRLGGDRVLIECPLGVRWGFCTFLGPCRVRWPRRATHARLAGTG